MDFDNIIRIIWIINFFFFALVLIFIWAKVLIISRRLKSITGNAKKSKDLMQSYKQVIASGLDAAQK